MAAFNIVTWDATNNRNKQVPSASSAFDFSSVRIGADNLVISEASSSAFSFNSKKLSNVTDPSAAQDAATKNYVDAAVAGATSFTYVAAASAANQNVAAFAGSTLDGVTLVSGTSYILLMGQTTASQNGVWLFNGAAAALTRPASGPWAAAAVAAAGAMIEVGNSGAQYGNQIYSLNAAGTVGSSSLAFSNEGFNPGNMPSDLLPYVGGSLNLGSSTKYFSNAVINSIKGNSDSNANVNVNSRNLNDSAGTISLDYSGRQLRQGATSMLDWSAASTLNAQGNNIINTGNILANAADTQNIGSTTSKFASIFVHSAVDNGSIPQINFQNRQLNNGSNSTMLDWSGSVISLLNKRLTLVADPTSAQDAATKNYVDTAVASASSFTNVVAVADSNILISNPGTAVFDGVTATSGQLILLIGQSTASQNGVWVFNGSGSALSRPLTGPFVAGAVISAGVLVEVLFGGTRYADTIYALNVGGTVNTSSLNFSLSGFNASSVPSALLPYLGTAGMNLGSTSKFWSLGYISQLIDPSLGQLAITMPTRLLVDSTGTASSIDWTNRFLYDSTGNTVSVDYQARQLKSGATIKLDWSAADVSLNTRKLINVVDPSAAQDAATKNYADTQDALKANKALDNLASVAINASLLPGVDNSINLGSTAKRWSKLYAVQANDLSDVKSVDIQARQLFSSAGAAVAGWSTANLDLLSNKIVSLANPTAAQDAATKAYVDAVATGLTPKASVQAATAAVLSNTPTYSNGTAGVGATLTAGSNGALVIDGYTVLLNQRVLVKNQASGFQNGIYTLTTLGTGGVPYVLTRATDADTCQPASNPKVTSGIHMFIEQGSTYSGQGWVLTTIDPITLGTTALVFSQFSSIAAYSAGNGIDITGNVISARIDGNALQFSGGVITLTLNGSTLNSSASGLKVSDLGITAAQIANATITATQLAASVAGNGLTGGAGVALAVVADPDVTLAVSGSGVRLNAYENYINDNAGSINAAQIVYIKTNGNVDLASNTVASNAFQLGVVKAGPIASTNAGSIWTQEGVKIGGFSSLTVGAPVYVSNTAGGVTQTTSGFTAGQFLYQVGYAISATTIRFEPNFLLEW